MGKSNQGRGMHCQWSHLPVLLFFVLLRLQGIKGIDREDAFIGYSEKGPLENNPKQKQNAPLLTLKTDEGVIQIQLLRSKAPLTVKWLEMAMEADNKTMEGRTFYRAESVEEGYGLVQGRFGFSPPSLKLPLEAIDVKHVRGSAALIVGTSDFFISLKDHPEWDGKFTIFGKLVNNPGVDGEEGMKVLGNITSKPVQVMKHPTYGTHMRMLLEPVPFQAAIGTSQKIQRGQRKDIIAATKKLAAGVS